MVCPTMSGMIVERRDQVLMSFFSPLAWRASIFLSRCSSTNGPFFSERGIGSPPRAAGAAATHDQTIGRLVLATGAALGLAPGRDRVPAARGLALATAERVVDGVHGHAAGLRAHALPAVATGLAELDQLVLGVADPAHRRPAAARHPAHLGRRQAQGGVVALLGQQHHGRAGRPGDLAAAARLELDVVDGGADRDVAGRQRIAGPDLGPLPRLQAVADLHVTGGDDVALLAVEVVQQRDAARPVGVVLDRGDDGGHAVLVAPEVDEPVAALVATAAVAGGLAPVDVAAAARRLRHHQRPLGPVAGDLAEVADGLEPPSGAGRLALAESHQFGLTHSSNRSIDSPSARVTIALFVSGRLP